MSTLKGDYNAYSRGGMLNKNIPAFIVENLNPIFELRSYQKEAIIRFIHYVEYYPQRIRPSHLLFHMATGSGKTLLMAANILYLYNRGYRNFLFFVDSTNIIEKTKDNFLNLHSSKYLFNDKIKFEDKEVKLNKVDNFETINMDNINIAFTTIQGLHNLMNNPKENSLTYEDFKDKEIVILSDEAHHINAWTKGKLNESEDIGKKTWEHTVNNIFNSNTYNIMLEYTATIDLDDTSIYEKYKNKIIYEYSLKQFRLDGYSKEVKVLQADLENIDRMLQAILLSQYRRKVAERNGLRLKPVILFKSKYIKDSKENYEVFHKIINKLSIDDIKNIEEQAEGNILEKAFDFFKTHEISFLHLVMELKEEFSEEKCILLDSNNIDEEDQIKLNTLEDKDNEIRAIFAVKMLDEGWDVLNLFDIVRLYETRDGTWLKNGTYKPGKTTLSEVQLIGRGARYYPFNMKNKDNKYKRKFDMEPEKDLRIIEELYYHSTHKPKYIQELKTTLRDSGIMPPNEPKTIQLKVKDCVKKTPFWEKGFIFVNRRERTDRSDINSLDDLDIAKHFGPLNLRTGFMQEGTIFGNNPVEEGFEKVTKSFRLEYFNRNILRKAIAKLEFYKFHNFRKYFPNLDSMNTFLDWFTNMSVDLRSSEHRLNNLTPDDKLDVCLQILNQLENNIKSGYTDYEGTTLFVQRKVNDIVKDKTLNINVGDISDQEYGIPMSNPRHEDLRLNLTNKNWYVYDENYGTIEEKHFIQFINGIMSELEENYEEIYLVRNANLFKIYRFSDGKAIEPDFVVSLKEKGNDEVLQYQLFVEPKGTHLLQTDKWKEDFLKEIEDKCEIQKLVDNKEYRIIGLLFYNEDKKTNFIDIFKDKLDLK